MTALTANKINNDLISLLKKNIERDVERLDYVFSAQESKVYCRITMRNGFMFEGSVFSMLISPNEKDAARKKAMEKVVVVEQYILAERLYQQAEYDNQQKHIR